MNEMKEPVQTKSAQLAKQWTEQAAEAIQNTDTAALRSILDEALKHNAQLATVLDGLTSLWQSKDAIPRYAGQQSENAIAAMRDVALAAVELSKAVIENRS